MKPPMRRKSVPKRSITPKIRHLVGIVHAELGPVTVLEIRDLRPKKGKP